MKKIIIALVLLLKCISVSLAQLPIAHCTEDLIPKYDKSKKLWGYSNLFGQWLIEPTYTKVSPFIEDKAVVQKGLSYGVIACDGQVIIPNSYEDMTNYRAGKLWAKKNKLWGVLDNKGKTLLDFQYSEINPIKSTSLSWVKKDELWGLFDEEKGRMICQPQYPMATIMSPNASLVKLGEWMGVLNHVNCGYLIKPEITKVKKVAKSIIIFKQNNKWGLFNEYGILRLNPEFDTLFTKFPETIVGIKSGKLGLYDLIGKELLPPVYDNFGELNEGLFSISKNQKYGFATRQGKIIVPLEYDSVQKFRNQRAIVIKASKTGIIDVSNKVRYNFTTQSIAQHELSGNYIIKTPLQPCSIFNSNLTQKISTTFDSIVASDKDSIVRAIQNQNYYYVNIKTGQSINGIAYQKAIEFDNGIALNKTKFWGAINKSGKETIKNVYDTIYPISWGSRRLWLSLLENKLGVNDSSGNAVIPNQYQQIHYLGNGLLGVKQNNKWKFIKTNNTIANETEFDDIFLSQDSVPQWPMLVKQSNKLGLINEKAQQITEVAYDSIKYLGHHLYSLKKGKNLEIIDRFGKKINEQNYSDLLLPIQQSIIVKTGKKWGIIHLNGNTLVEPKFESLQYTSSGNYFLYKNKSQWGIIDKSGKEKSKPQFDTFEINNNETYLSKSKQRYLMDKNGMITLKP